MTDSPVIPEEVKLFLLRNIDSVAQWEGLLLMRAHADKEWNAPALALRLYISEQEAQELLASLAERTILVAVETPDAVSYRYQPKSPALKQMIDHAAEVYQRYLIPVTHLIHSNLKNQVQQFADAFKIGKD